MVVMACGLGAQIDFGMERWVRPQWVHRSSECCRVVRAVASRWLAGLLLCFKSFEERGSWCLMRRCARRGHDPSLVRCCLRVAWVCGDGGMSRAVRRRLQ